MSPVFHFPGMGTLVNMLLIIGGSLIGMFFGKRFPQRVREIVMQASGLVVLFIGVSGLLSAVFTVDGQTVSGNYTLAVVISLILGAIIGELLDIEGHLQRGGEWLQQRMRGHGNSRIAEGFCMTTILYCTGAMAIVGSLNDALLRDATVLCSKGIIDGMTAIVFASTLGIGVLFSAFGVGLYQGMFTLLAALIEPLLTDVVVAQMSAVGSLIIIGIAFNLLELKKFRIGNMLPGIFLPLIWDALMRLF